MEYVVLVNFISGTAFAIGGALFAHFIFFAIVGFIFKKRFASTDKKLRYGILIPTRNEEAVIGNLIDSINANKYPKDKIEIFVVAHNCTDNTADVARKKGAVVYEYNNPDERTKGYALKYLFNRIEEDFGTQNFDGFFIFDGDNILTEDYIDKMNDAFVSCGGKNVITSFRNSKNFGRNIISAMYGLYFFYGCRAEYCGRTVLGCSTRVSGTGYVFPSELVKNGWNYVTLTEDWELTADLLIDGKKIIYCNDAMFYDEQPTTLKVMCNQRIRWARGHLLVFKTRFLRLLRALFTSKKRGGAKYKVSTYDIAVNILPVGVMGMSIVFLQFIALLFSPLFGYNLGFVLLDFLVGYGVSILTTCLTTFAGSLLILIIERKRYPKINPIINLLAIIFWPLFILLAAPFDVISLFSPNLGWKAIPHNDTTDLNSIRGNTKTK